MLRYLTISGFVALAGLLLLVFVQQERINVCLARNASLTQNINLQNAAIQNFETQQKHYQEKIKLLDAQYNKQRKDAFDQLSEQKKLDLTVTCMKAVRWAAAKGVVLNAGY